jgi:hypothetical protein
VCKETLERSCLEEINIINSGKVAIFSWDIWSPMVIYLTFLVLLAGITKAIGCAVVIQQRT